MKINDVLNMRKVSKSFKINEVEKKKQKGKSSARDPKNSKVFSVTPKIGGDAPGQFEDSPVDLSEIGRAYHSDSYIRRAVDKIVGLMFKSGWSFNSLNQEALDYVETRFRLMEESTGLSTEELLREAGMNFVLYANSPFVKTRGQENLGGLNASGYYGGDPISGIFPAPPEFFQVLRDEFGNIEGYNVSGDGAGSNVEFTIEDVSHLTYHKPTGRAYGIPYIDSVIDDVLILRQLEKNVARLVYRNIFPLQSYVVGLPEAGFESTPEEIEEVRAMIEDATLDSIFVMPERHKLVSASNGSSTIDVNNYLRYFRQRVFTGLGVSESTMGIGDSSNKSTSDNQSSDLIDLVKDFQQTFAAEFQREIVNEILFEGGFDPTINKEERVQFRFVEIEQSAKIARENHEMQKFLSNMQSLDKTLNRMDYEPETDYSHFYFNLFGKNAYDSNSAKGTVDNKDKPENQAGKKDGPNKDSLKDNFVEKIFEENDKTLLTNQNVMVTLTTGSEKEDISQELTKNWQLFKQNLENSNEKSIIKENIDFNIDIFFQEKYFENKKHHDLFKDCLKSQLSNILIDRNEKENLPTQINDLLYKYEDFVLELYKNSKNKN